MPTDFYKTMAEVDGRKRCVVNMMAVVARYHKFIVLI